MNIASIDIGSNTVILLIAEINEEKKTITNVYDLQFIPRISEGVLLSKKIHNDKIEELINILSVFKKISTQYSCSEIFALGTNAFRISTNSLDVIAMVKKKLGINIEILSADLEAEYSFIGATYDKNDYSNSLVIDIGGGSTEIILGKKSQILFKVSLPIGVVSLKEKYQPYNSSNFDIMGANKEISNLLERINAPELRVDHSIAIAGTPTTLAAIKKNLNAYDEKLVEGEILTSSDIKNFIDKLASLNNLEILKTYKAVVNNREDLLLSGSLLLYNMMNYFNLSKVVVSSKGLRYGPIIKKYF
jgi:exopolyphosphatase/guanosine-5'-triphosphate,3'-diphosphate pyrophosphatase